jgi:hypothetical protein
VSPPGENGEGDHDLGGQGQEGAPAIGVHEVGEGRSGGCREEGGLPRGHGTRRQGEAQGQGDHDKARGHVLVRKGPRGGESLRHDVEAGDLLEEADRRHQSARGKDAGEERARRRCRLDLVGDEEEQGDSRGPSPQDLRPRTRVGRPQERESRPAEQNEQRPRHAGLAKGAGADGEPDDPEE